MGEIRRWEDIPEEDRKHLESLLRNIGRSLQKVEDTVRKLGINLPVENLEIPRYLRISLPKGYFRKKIKKYTEIVHR